MLIHELVSYLQHLLHPSLYKDFCPNGLQVGSNDHKVLRIGTAVTADLATIQQAIDQHIDTLIVHHGLFWNQMNTTLTDILYQRVRLLMQHNIALLAYHLPLDGHQQLGNSWKAAIDLQWSDLQEFGSYSPALGVMGRFTPINLKQFKQTLSEYYNAPILASAEGGPHNISSAAIMSGGAYKELAAAAKSGVDCFITGNFDEPAWSIAHESGMHFFALGHTATEKIGVKALSQHLSEQGFFSIFLDTNNPF